MRHFLSLLVLTLALPAAAYAQSNQACINYWSVGPTGCDGRPEPAQSAPQPVMPTPMPAMQKPMPVSPVDPVEQFYQTYDKPPRAFVEFQVNPTPTTAMAWVKEYQSIINKSSETAEAWRQAEDAYTQYQKTGQFPQQFTQALSDEERLQLANIMRNAPAAKPEASNQAASSNLPQAFQDAFRGIPTAPLVAAAQMPAAQQSKPKSQAGNNALAALNKGSLVQPNNAASDGNNLSMAALNRGEEVANDVIKVNYYFSAVCPFCHRFEAELARVQREFTGKRLEVTCVDMTPNERVPANKQASINCKWRPLAPGEKDANQVRATPSLLVDFGPTKSLELVEGYVEADKLLSYLNTKAAQ